MNRCAALALSAAVFSGGACSTEPPTAEHRAILQNASDSAMDRFYAADPGMRERVGRAAGYAIFPDVKKVGVGVGGAYGKGEVHENGVMVGYCDLSAGTVGLQLGAEAYSELVLFENRAALDSFKAGEFSLSANASAAAGKSGDAAATDYRDGVAVYIYQKGGLMAEASVGGQKFTYRPL